jgi:preprotein translocase subunit SecD
MLHYSRWQTAAILGVAMLVSLAAVPNVLPASARAALPNWAQRTFVLGYDLQGGEYTQFEVDAENMRQHVLQETRDEMRGLLRWHRVHFTGLVIRNDGVEAWIREPADMPRVVEAFNNLVRPIDPAPPASDRRMLLTRHVDGRPGIWASRNAEPVPSGYHLDIADRMVRLTPTDAVLRQRVAQARRANEAAIRERLRFMGAEKLVAVSAVGADRIVVDAPYSEVIERFRALRF